MIDIKKIFKRSPAERPAEPRIKRLEISPSPQGLYIDTDGIAVTPLTDTIGKKDFKWVRDSYSVVVPGLMEWYGRYLHQVSNPDDGFDWSGWHRDGLLFTKEIYLSLPRSVPMRYVVPAEDRSNTLESFDVTEGRIDSLLDVIGNKPTEREAVAFDNIAVGVKEEDGYIVVRLKTKGKFDNITFQMGNESLELVREFLEKIALTDHETVSCESRQSDFDMYFYPQTIGGLKHMGQLHIFSDREFAFSAYINSRHFVRSLYRSIISYAGSLNDSTVYKLFQSRLLECYIDDARYRHISRFRTNPQLANLIGPALDNIRKHFLGIYDSIIEEDEYV